MRERDNYRHGDHNVICDYSGFKFKRSECRYTWDGFLVNKRFWEPRHPQDFVKVRGEQQSVPDTRPEESDNFLTTNEVTRSSL